MSWFLRPLVYGAEKIFKDFLKKLLGDFVELHNFKLEPLQGGFTGTLDGLHLKVAEINTLLGDIPLTLESGIIAKASVEISVKRECRLHLDGVELHFLVGTDAMVRIKQEAKAEDLTRSTTEGKYQRQSDSENDDDSEAESEGEGEGEDGEQSGGRRTHKEMVTFTVLKEKIKEILRRVERVDVSNVHVLLSTKEGKGKQELHLHFNHLRYEDATQPESAPVPSPKSSARGVPAGAAHGTGSVSEEEEIKIESSKVVKWLEVEGLKVMVEEFYKHKEGDEEMLEIRPTKLLEISTVPQRNYSRMDDAEDRSEYDDEDEGENDTGPKGKKRDTGGTRPTKNLSGRMQINLTVGQTVVVEEVDMAFDHHRIDVIVPPKYLKFVLDLADRFNARKSDDSVSTSTTTPTTTDNGVGESPNLTANAGLSVPVYAFPKCTLHVNRGSVILLEEDMPSPADEGHAVGASIKMGTSQSSEREMFTANSSSAMIADSVSQLDFVPFDRVPRFSWSFERASIALSSRMLPPPPPPIPEALPSPLASGYYSPHSSLTPPPAVRPPTRVPPPSSALLVEIRMRDCDLVEFIYERRARDDGAESEDEDGDRRRGNREIRFDLIRLGVKEDEDEEDEEDVEDDGSVNHGEEMDGHGNEEGTATLVGDERFLIRFEKKVRIEEREIEASPPQTSFDNIDAEELAGIGVPPPPSSRNNSGFDQLGDHPRSDSANAVDSSELMVWEETKLTIETARLNIETDTKITERLERLRSQLSAPSVALPPETSSPPPPTWEEFLKEQARKEEEQRTREEAIAASGTRPFENWSIQRNFFIDVGARKKLRATIHFYDAHGRRRKEKLDVLLFDTDKIKFSTCISSFDSSDQGLCAAFQDATILEFDFENIMATITSRLGFPKAPFFRASMADTHGERVTPLEITLKPPTSLQANDENIVGEMTALVGKKGHAFSSSEVERMNHFKYLSSQLAGVAIKIRFPFSEIELEKYDYDAIMAILDNLSSPAPPPASMPPPPPVVAVPSASASSTSTASSPAHARVSPATSPSPRGAPVSFLENKAPRYRLDASTIVEVTLTHANLKLIESRGKASSSDDTAKTKQPTYKPFHLHFVDVERLSIFFAGARFNEKPSNWLSVDADNFLLYERLMSASRSSVYTPATLVVNRNPFVTSAAAARPVFSSLFLLTGPDNGVKNRMDFNDLIIHHKAGFQWYNHLGTFFSGEEQVIEQKAEDRKAAAPDAAEDQRAEGSEASVTQLFINLPNLELEYTPTLVPGNAFITTGYLQVDLLIFSGRKDPKRVADIPRLELNIVAKPRKVNAGRNIAIYIARSSAEEEEDGDADVDENEMARQKRLHWRSNGKRYLKAGVLNSAFSVRLKSRLVDDEDHFLRLLRACGQPTPENENEHESDGVSGIDLRGFCDDASVQHGTPGLRSRKRTMGRWMTKLTLCQYDVNDDKSKTEENVRPFLLGFCADSLSTFVDIFNEALLPADLVLADIDPDAQAKRDEMAQQQRLRKEREEKRRAAMKRKQDEQRRKARSERGNQSSSREGTAELIGGGGSGSISAVDSREGSGADGLDVSRIREGLPPEIAEKIRKQDEIRIEEARRRDRGRRSRSSSLTSGNGDAEKKDKIHVSEARLQNGIWYTDPRKMKIIPDYWHTPGDSRLLPDPVSISSFCVTVKSGLSINLRLYSGLDWPALAHAAPKGTKTRKTCAVIGYWAHELTETILDRQMDSFFEVRLTGLKLRFDEFLRQPLFPRRIALAVHDLTVVDSVGPAQRGKVDFFAHNKKKDRLAETAMLYFTLTCHKKGEKNGGAENANDESDEDEMDVDPDEEYWQGALEMPAPLRIKVHENVLKLLLFSHHPFFPLATTELPTTPPMLIRGFRVGPLVAKIDWSGWSYSDELLAALTPENLGGIIVDRNTLVGYGVFLSGYKALTAISLRWGERQFSGLYYGWGELVGKIVELYAIDVVTRKPHKVIGAIGGIRHVKEAVRMGSEAIVANLPALPVSVPLPDVYAIGEYINTETIGSALGYASSVTSYLSTQALSSSSSFVSSVYAQAAQLAFKGLEGAPPAIGAGSGVPAASATPTTKKGRVGRRTKREQADENDENAEDSDVGYEDAKSVKGKERIQARRSDSEPEDEDEDEVEVDDEEPKVRVFGGGDDGGRRPAVRSYDDDDDDDEYSDDDDDSYDESDRATATRERERESERERERERERRAAEAEEQRRRKEKLARRQREERERREREAAEAQERLRVSERKATSPAKSTTTTTNKGAKATPTKPPKKKPASYSDDNGSDDDFSMEWKD